MFMKWFNSQSRLVQIILLLIPGVNWLTEILVRVSSIIEKQSLENVLGLIFSIIIPFFGYLDLVWVLLFNRLILCD